MFKGKEGIALILAIFFVLVISMLLMAILLLTNQEINATQLQLDSNKAFYFAEAGVEYGLAQVINGKTVEDLNKEASIEDQNKYNCKSEADVFLIKNFGDSNINYLDLKVENPSTSDYIFTCEVRYNKARRKVRKEVELYTGVWSKAMGSGNGITLSVVQGQTGNIIINGDIYANGDITGKKEENITINGNVYATGTIGDDIQVGEGFEKFPGASSLPFPSTDFDYYKSIADYKYENDTKFIEDLKKNSLQSGVVYIEGDLDLVNLDGLTIKNLTLVVNGKIVHTRNVSNITFSGDGMIALIARDIFFNNVSNLNFNNCIIYATDGNVDFTNAENVKIGNGAIYAQQGYIGLDTIKKTFTVNRGTWEYTDIPFLFDIYKTVLWTDTGI